jgi:hypothetical protein
MSIPLIVLIALVVLVLLSAGGYGYGRYYAVPAGAEPGPWVNPMGIVAALLVVLLILWLIGGFGLHLWVTPPP